MPAAARGGFLCVSLGGTVVLWSCCDGTNSWGSDLCSNEKRVTASFPSIDPPLPLVSVSYGG